MENKVTIKEVRVKKVLFVLAVVLVSGVFMSSNALSFRQTASLLKGGNTTTDTANVTFAERVQAMHIVLCGRASRGVAQNLRADYTNYTQFTDQQFIEFYNRGMNGELQGRVLGIMMGSYNVDLYGESCTDGQLETSYKNVMFGLVKLIGTGSL